MSPSAPCRWLGCRLSLDEADDVRRVWATTLGCLALYPVHGFWILWKVVFKDGHQNRSQPLCPSAG